MLPLGEPQIRALLAVSLSVNLGFVGLTLFSRLRSRPDAMGEYRRARADLLASLETRGPELLLLGDSLTDRGEWAELLGPGVINRGVASDRVRDAAARAPEAGRRDPKRIAVLIGINDLLHGASAADVARDYGDLITALQREAPRARLFIQSVLPVRRVGDAEAVNPGAVQALNARLAALSAERGAVFVDLAPRFAAAGGELDPSLTTDGVHLTARGYQLWRDALRAEVLGGSSR